MYQLPESFFIPLSVHYTNQVSISFLMISMVVSVDQNGTV